MTRAPARPPKGRPASPAPVGPSQRSEPAGSHSPGHRLDERPRKAVSASRRAGNLPYTRQQLAAWREEGWTPKDDGDWWLTPQALGEAVGYSTRQLLNLEAYGLPVRVDGGVRRYPWRDCRDWTFAHRRRMLERRPRADFIPIEIARAEYALHCARENAAAEEWYRDRKARGLPIIGDEDEDP